VNLKYFLLNIQNITDFTPLKDLVGLETLGLVSSPASSCPPAIDFSPLGGLSNLTTLFTDLDKNSDFSSLAALPNLNNIQLSVDINDGENNTADDLSQLSRLVSLEHLCVAFSKSEISDLSPLSSLINLKYLELRCNRVKTINYDLNPLRTLTKLEKFIIYDAEISDLSPVAHVKNVRTEPISVTFPVVKNKEPIPKSPALPGAPVFKDVCFEKIIRNALNNPAGDITNEDMAGIEKLFLRGFVVPNAPPELEFYDISGIEYCVNLKHLRLSYMNPTKNFVFDISPVSHLINLRTLSINSDRNVIDISPLSKLANLTNLFLDINIKVTDISPLSTLTELTQLVLIQSGVRDLSPLKGLSKLEELFLVGNIKDYSPVAHVKDVQNIGGDLFGGMKSTWDSL
jgi:internalin A